MPAPSRTVAQIVDELLTKAIKQEDCLICHLKPNKRGYSPVTTNGRLGKKWRAHRLVWAYLKGDLEDDKMVLHSCDNRRCININHLRVGTAAENSQDMVDRGRHNNGTEGIAQHRKRQIAVLRSLGFTVRQMSDFLELNYESVRAYIKTDKYTHVEY